MPFALSEKKGVGQSNNTVSMREQENVDCFQRSKGEFRDHVYRVSKAAIFKKWVLFQHVQRGKLLHKSSFSYTHSIKHTHTLTPPTPYLLMIHFN